nr:hypothetical protein [Tanacetum cinerariifolium]
MITFLTKSDASKGFEQIINFLNASVIQHALMVNLTIYVSCIKQFWSSVSLKKTNDVVRLQAQIDRRKVIITEDTVRQALRSDDADNINCLPNEEIFAQLARMGYEKPSANLVRNVDSSSKFYMYPRFLQLMINDQVGDLSSHTTKYTSPAFTQKIFANMRRVGKGFSGVDTLLFEGMLVPQQVNDDVADVAPTPPPSPHQSPIAQPSSPPQPQPSQTPNISMDLLSTLLETCTTLTRKVENLEQDKIAQALEITKIKQRVWRLEKRLILLWMIRRMHPNRGEIAKIDDDEDVTLEEVDAEVTKDIYVQGRLEESQAQVYHLDSEHAQKVLSMQDDEAEPAELKEVIEVVITAKLMTEVVTAATTTITVAPMPQASAARRRNNVVIRNPKKIATPSVIVHSEPKSKDKGKGILIEEPKPLKKQAQIEQDKAYARELEAELNANINWNEVIEQKKRQAIKSKRKNETSEEKAAKKQKLDEEVEELKTHLQIVPNNEDDVYTKATLLALKRRLGDVVEDCSRMICIFRAKELLGYGLAKVKSWKLLEFCGVHIITFTTTQMILLVERRYPLTRFIQDQMLNDVRLEVEEESEVSLELLRFVRRQQQEGYRPE